MNASVRALLTRTLLLVVLASSLVAGPVGAGSSKSADVRLDFLQTTDGCQPSATVTWSGYRVHHVRVIYYLEGHGGEDAAWLNTPQFPDDRARSSGSLTSLAGVAAAPGSGWWAYAILRSVGGARLAEVASPVAYAPDDCPAP